jgi:DDE superfamily endonuclease
MLSYRVMLDVPFQLAVFVSGLLADHRHELGTRDGTRALTCWKQAIFALAWFRDRPDIRRLGAGFGISQATAYRYKDEAVQVLAAKAPSLREALDKAVEQGLPYLILDGTLISSDRCAGTRISRKGKEIDVWYSGKAHEPAGNVQALAAPGGVPLWVSDVLPGSTHDLTAAREFVLPGARPYLKDLPFLADSGYEGAGAGVLVPVKKPVRGELDIDTKTRNALLRSLRYQGERGFALMSQRWRALRHVMVSPSTIGDLAKVVLVLVQFEHKMIS